MNHIDEPVPWPAPAQPTVSEPFGRWLASIQRRNPGLLARAHAAGCPIHYLGTAPLPGGPVAYAGHDTDWILSPATGKADLTVPRAIRMGLQSLDDEGVQFPLIFIAHEVPKGRLDLSAGQLAIDQRAAAEAVGPVPPPRSAVDVAGRAGRRSQVLLTVLGKVLPVAGAIVASPFLAVGAVLAGLDPIVFGVIPDGPPAAGRTAAWYVLASWNWE